MQRAFDVVVIAASWGGIAAVSTLLAALPADFPASILVVQHLSPRHVSHLDAVLARSAQIPVLWAQHEAALQPGTVVLAPPDWLVRLTARRTLALAQDSKIHWTRPAADPLFESVAAICGARAIGVVLTGLGQDGARGVQAIKGADGRVFVQDSSEADEASMPRAALATGCVDFALPVTTLANGLISLVMVPGAAALFRVQAPGLVSARRLAS